MNNKFYDLIRSYPDFPKPGILFRDIFPLIAEVKLFREAVEMLAQKSQHLKFDKIVSIEARGFIIGSALSLATDISMIPVRKPGKLPGKTISYKYELEYGHDYLQMPEAMLKEGDRVLLADDVLATGGTAIAAMELIKLTKAVPVGLTALIELDYLAGRQKLTKKGLEVVSLLHFED